MAEAIHEILGGRVQLYRRTGSSKWWSRASVGGKQFRQGTKEESLSKAKDVAEDWFLTLKGKAARGEIKTGKTFKEAAERYIDEFEIVTQGERSPLYVAGHRRRINLYLIPFFGSKVLSEITSGMIQDYRIHRMKNGRDGKPPSRSTLHQELVCFRQALKFANRHGWMPALPDMSAPYRASSKVSHRAWFSPDEYKRLYEAARDRAKNPKKERWRSACEDLLDYILFQVNTGLRPDETKRLQVRDIEIAEDGPDRERILHIAVRGKRGTGWAKSMPGAVIPFKRMKDRHKLGPTDLVFPTIQRELFNTLLAELEMKKDREGNARTTYSLRHTYISLRLLEGADIYQVAKNCRTSVEMIEKYYASHIKNMLDAGAINVRRPTPPRKSRKQT